MSISRAFYGERLLDGFDPVSLEDVDVISVLEIGGAPVVPIIGFLKDSLAAAVEDEEVVLGG